MYTNSAKETKIYYETVGTGMPLLFIHPPGMGHVTFTKQKELADEYQVILYDIRGNGRSDVGLLPMTMELLIEDVKSVLDDLSIEKAIICGYSNGGCIAQEFALTYPERVKGLILFGGFPEVNSYILRKEFQLGIWATRNKLVDLMAFGLSKAHWKNKQMQQELRDYIKQNDMKTTEEMYKETLHYNSTDRLQEINVPVLIMYGSLEFYTHHYGEQFQEKLKNVEVVHISKATHQIPTKHFREANHIIKDFINRKIKE